MQMADAMAKVKAEMVICEDQIQKQVDLMDKNKNEILSAEKKMTDAVDELIRDLREHERTIKVRLHEIYEAQQKHHSTQLENFELVVTQLKIDEKLRWTGERHLRKKHQRWNSTNEPGHNRTLWRTTERKKTWNL